MLIRKYPTSKNSHKYHLGSVGPQRENVYINYLYRFIYSALENLLGVPKDL